MTLVVRCRSGHFREFKRQLQKALQFSKMHNDFRPKKTFQVEKIRSCIKLFYQNVSFLQTRAMMTPSFPPFWRHGFQPNHEKNLKSLKIY